jgi:starch-binding outer membrane protein, SusD/RagB family
MTIMTESMSYRIKFALLLLALPVCWQGCSKKAFLDAKPTTNLLVPTQLSDFQALLDNTTVFGFVPTLGEASADNYFFANYTYWNNRDTREKNAYIWASDIFDGEGGQLDWNTPYQQVYYANLVLDGLGSKPVEDSVAEWEALEGSALFFRAFAFYNVAQVFAPVYDQATSAVDSGIPLRLHSAIDQPSRRATVAQTYQQIINDLDSAEMFLPAIMPNSYRNRPGRIAAQALLARVYLSMRNYQMARAYADSALQFYDSLLDYNGLDSTFLTPPFNPLNCEVLYQATFLGYGQFASVVYPMVLDGFSSSTRIDTLLMQSYDSNDLRRNYYYRYNPPIASSLRFSYNGSQYPFGGLATDELYLIRAECAARLEDGVSAMKDINTLLAKRWRPGTFTGYSTAISWQDALDTVLVERRKELAFRGLRWTDLRRFNADGAGITLNRILIDTTNKITYNYSLPAGSDLWVLPIPPDVLSLGSIGKNPRN